MRAKKDQISVVIPVHNRPHAIRRAIDSVLAQELYPDEIIVVDDGSDDKTPYILESYVPKIQIVTQDNKGVSAARNRGVEASTGRWIAFLDSDDEWERAKLQKQMSFMKRQANVRISQTEERWIRNNMKVNPGKKYAKKSGNIFKSCLKTCIVGASTVILERSLFDEMGGFDESLTVCEDYDLWNRIAAKYPIPLLSQALTVKYGGHPDQLSNTPAMDRYRTKSLMKIFEEGDLSHQQKTELLDELILKLSYLYEGAVRSKRESHGYLKDLMYYKDVRAGM